MQQLVGKVAIITGGAKGIGKATALKFLAEGAAVAIWDIDESAGAATLREAAGQGGQARFYRVDTTDFAAASAAARKVDEDFGGIDILVNNAGITRDASLKKMTPEQWRTVIDVNLTGVFNCTKAVFPFLEQRGSGRILNAASVVALYGNFGQTNYAATKSGVIGMTKVWARELGRKGITVNAVAPGFIQTEMVETIPEHILVEVKAKTPLGRLGQAEDIANAYAFLASDAAAFITGATLSVDGGIVL
jgi:3-oxoacyl-[acyl-carrier protein] reductase